MSDRSIRAAILLLGYLVILEGVSWWTSSIPGTCLISPEQHNHVENYNEQQACPTFFRGSLILLGWADRWLEHHDKGIVAVFTIVLAISTIGLWKATRDLWRASESELAHLKESAERQSREMDASIRVAQISADAAALSARAAIGLKLPIVRCDVPTIFAADDPFERGGIGASNLFVYDFHKIIDLEFRNRGETPFYPTEVGLGWLLTEQPAVELETVPNDPDYTDIHSISGETVVQELFRFPTHETFVIRTQDPALKADLNGGRKNVRVLAYIKYRDFLGDAHEARFCWRWSQGSRDGRYRPGLLVDDRVPESYTRKT
jgi:hypothetical protein